MAQQDYFTSVRRYLKQAGISVFFIILSIFFYGIYYQLISQLDAFNVKLQPNSCLLILFFSFLFGTCCLVLSYLSFKGKALGLWISKADEECKRMIREELDNRHLFWIAVSSGLVLFLELCIIRWVSALIPELSQYRNFSLLACFLGIGIGYLTGSTRSSFIILLLPLLGLQFMQLSMISQFYPAMTRPGNILWIFAKFPAWQFVMIILTTIGSGQLVGCLLSHKQALKAYSANLLGSILGVLVFNAAAALWLPPWFWLLGIAGTYIFMFHRLKNFMRGLIVFFVFLGVSYLLYEPSALEIYSPYQRITLKTYGIGHQLGDGRYGVYSNSLYYQSFSAVNTDKIIPQADVQHLIPNVDLGPVVDELKGKKILALGAGTGANVPALLKAQVASVVAVDIDPTIVYLGKKLNANYPYWDPKVQVVVNDGRAFLRETKEKFDYIFFLWIDSHPYVTSSYGFRVDSFIYTQESFKQALSHLNPGGKILVYAWMNGISSKRIYMTLKQATNLPIYTFKVIPYDYQGLYIVSKEAIAQTGSRWVVPWAIDFKNPAKVHLLSDDWPFLYILDGNQGILKFLPFLGMVLGISISSLFLSMDNLRLRRDESKNLIVFFLFGVAFMMLETISIMRNALLMGNTWQVTGYVIMSILIMAFIGNWWVSRFPTKFNFMMGVIGLFLSLAANLGVDVDWLITTVGNYQCATVVYLGILSLPIIFSSILFSFLIKNHPRLDLVMGSNLLGAMVGGCLEYIAMVTGYHALLFIIPGIYLAALVIFLKEERSLEG